MAVMSGPYPPRAGDETNAPGGGAGNPDPNGYALHMNREEYGGSAPTRATDPPDEETGQFGDSTDPGIESDEDLDGERDADGAPPLHHPEP